MTKYELLYIIPSKYSEEEIKPITKSVDELLKKFQAKIVNQEDLGKRKLAYTINQNHYGYYVLVNFDCRGENIDKIEKQLKLMPEVLRHQIVHRLDPKKTTGKPLKEKPLEEKVAEPKETLIKTIDKDKEEEIKIKKPKVETKPEEKEDKSKQKVDLEELDQKLDELLKDDLNI